MDYFNDTYNTNGWIQPITSYNINNAISLNLGTVPAYIDNDTGIDNYARYSTSEDNALLNSTFKISFQEGAVYHVFSESFFDPYILRVADSAGNVLIYNDEGNDPSDDFEASYDHIYFYEAPYTGTYYISASWNQGSYYTDVQLTVFEDLDSIYSSSASEPSEPVQQTSRYGTDSSDRFNDASQAEIFYGQSGIDTVQYSEDSSNYTISVSDSNISVISSTSTDTLIDIERIQFNDKALAFDVSGNAGQAYRLYQAAFDRTPDQDGLGYWITQVDNGMSLENMANSFIQSEEFSSLYGTSSSDEAFIDLLYNNVLNRAADQAGYDYWINEMNNGLSRSSVLASFSESSENQNNVIGQIESGIEFII